MKKIYNSIIILLLVVMTGCLMDEATTVAPPAPSENNPPVTPPVVLTNVSPGIYLNRWDTFIQGKAISYFYYLGFNVNGTFITEGYMTSSEMYLNNVLFIELTGNYFVSEGVITLSNRLVREMNFDTGYFGPWYTPLNGNSTSMPIKNITSYGFQTFNDYSNKWDTWLK